MNLAAIANQKQKKKPRVARSMIGQNVDKDNDACFFCDLSGSDLRQVMTYKVDKRV